MTLSPNNSVIYVGGQWFTISRDFAEYVLADQIVLQKWRKYFTYFFAPEESILQTIAMNHPQFRESLVWHEQNADFIRGNIYTIWGGENCKSYPNPRPCCSPCALGSNDYDQILAARKEGWLFARKFYHNDSIRQRILQDAIEEEMLLRKSKKPI